MILMVKKHMKTIETIICHGQLFLISLSLFLSIAFSKSSAKLKASEKQPLHV